MLRKVTLLATAFGLALAAGAPAFASTKEEPKKVEWSFNGPFGAYDQEQLQRGYKVFHDVCSSCHSAKLVSYRNLGDEGGPFYNPEYKGAKVNSNPVVKAIAADFQVDDIDSTTGETIHRNATPADRFKAPFPNPEAAAAANGGATPPDMSVLAKAREGGPDYIYSIVTGYHQPPAGLEVPAGKYYNPYMLGDLTSYWKGDPKAVPVGGFIAMPPPLADNKVTYDDGVKPTLDQEAKDVSAFLMWMAEPKLNERHRSGFSVMIFLIIFSGLLYASYRQVWKNESH